MPGDRDGIEEEPPCWDLADHLRAGRTALAAIELHALGNIPQPVCHHFWEAAPVDPMEVSVAATYQHLQPRFEALDLRFALEGLEAWETVVPDAQWLYDRIPALIQIAPELIYAGWTWEPLRQPPISASFVEVFNFTSG